MKTILALLPPLQRSARRVAAAAVMLGASASAAEQIFNASDTFTVPAGVTTITVKAWGPGGTGVNSTSAGGIGGGGGGAFAQSTLTVTPLANLPVTIGGAGGDSNFGGGLVVAKGGASSTGASGAAGGSATASTGDIKWSGGNGANASGNSGGGGGGGATETGNGGNASGTTGGTGGGAGGTGGGNNSDGTAGSAPGGGGGGAGRAPGSGAHLSGAAGPGRIVVSWIVSAPEIAVSGNSVDIDNGDTTPDVADHTDFGSQLVSSGTVVRTFTITNSGGTALNLTGMPLVAVSGANAADFSVTLQPTSPVAVSGGTTTFQVTFDPSAPGLRTATLSIANDDSDENPFDFAIQGTGTAPEIAVSGNSVDIDNGDTTPDVADHTDFGSQLVSSGTVVRTFTITNSGTAALNLTGTPRVAVSGTHAADFTVTLDASTPVAVSGGTTTFQVTFDPSAPGLRIATLSIANDDSDENPFDFAIQGTGTAPEIAVSGNSVDIDNGDTTPDVADHTDFGSQLVSSGTVVRTFTITNSGTAALNLTGTPRVAVSGTHAADFTVTLDASTPVAVSGGTTTFQVTFDPSAPGLRTATLSIANDDSDENPFDFAIQGTGTAAEIAVFKGTITDPELTDNTGTQDFGGLEEGYNSPSQTFTIQNTGTSVLTLGTLTLAGTDPDQFSITQPADTSLDPTEVTTFTVTFSPTSTFGKSAVVNIPSNDSDENPFRINVSGIGGITHSVSSSIVPNASASCNSGGLHTDNGYWRAFTLSNFGISSAFSVSSVQIGVEGANAPSGSQPLTVRLYQGVAGGFPGAARTQIGTADFSVTNQSGSLITIPVFGTVPAGAELIVEVFTPNGQANGHSFFIGSNSQGQTGPSYLMAPSCAINSPTDLAALGFPNMHIVMSVQGGLAPEIAVHDGATTADPELTDAQVTPVAFGNTNLGSTTTRTFTVANLGSGNLTLGAITIDGPDAAAFSVTTAPTSPVTGPSGTTTFVVTFAPVTAGTKTAALHLVNNDANENPFDINLSGFGVLSPPIVVTSGSAGITAYTATVSGTVNPNYGASSAWFEYSMDPTLTTGVLSTPAQAIPYGFTATGITANLANLLAEQPYYFRAVASNDAGTTNGNILSFTTSYPVATDEPFDASTGLVGGGSIYRPVPGVINAAGRVSFRASLIGGVSGVSGSNDAILLSDTSGTLRVIAQEGAVVPSGGTLGGFFQYPILTPAGLTAVRDRFNAATAATDYAYLASDDGLSTGILSREGDTAPNGGVFTGHAGQPSADDQERVYFNGALSGVATTRNSGIWYDAGGTISKLVQEGENVSSLIGDPAWLGNISPTTSAAGDGVAFVAALQKNPANKLQTTAPARNQALIGGAPGSLAVIARKGDVIPGVGKIKSFTGVSRSSAGDHAFMSALTITTTAPAVSKLNDQVLLAKIGPIVHVVAREGTTEVIPASGLRTARFGHFYAAGDGSVLFLAWVAGSGVTTANDGVLCRWTVADGIEVLAREGDAAPGTGSTYTAFTGFSVSPGGAVALTATLANKRIVLLRALAGDDLSFVTQTTENISYNGAPRKILSLGIHTTGTGAGHGGNGKGAAINDEGDVFSVLSIGGGEYIARIFKLP
jgi:hypothetical protein